MNSGRTVIVVVLVCSLGLAGATRQWAQGLRESTEAATAVVPTSGASAARPSGPSLTGMNSYALALLLGGLRGPLVMFLWSSSETEKQAHNLEDFDTKVEWIRLLQPEFDTVHLFQIWNKAYNISVQMASLPNKYATILDALDYARSVDRQRPDDINIVSTVASLYADKLGNSTEKAYYIRRVRDETRAIKSLVRVTLPAARLSDFLSAARAAGMDEPSAPIDTDEVAGLASVVVEKSAADVLRKTFAGPGVSFDDVVKPSLHHNASVKRTRLDPLLDEAGNLLPELLRATNPRPANIAAEAPWYDGSEMQFLKAYQPFPYGLPPQAIGYNDYKRAQMLAIVAHQQHIQNSESVLDSRPALQLKAWGMQEGERGRRAELRLFGLDDRGERIDLEERAPGANPTATPDFANRPDPAAGPLALYSYALAARLFRDARADLSDHIRRFPNTTDVFNSHLDEMAAFEPLYQADSDFLLGVLDPPNRKPHWDAAKSEYIEARYAFELVILRYFVDDEVARAVFPKDPATGRALTRLNIVKLPKEARDKVMRDVLAGNSRYFQDLRHVDQYRDDREEKLNYIRRSVTRLIAMGLTAEMPTEAPPTTVPTVEPAGPSSAPVNLPNLKE